MRRNTLAWTILLLTAAAPGFGQVNEDALGAWYMYMWSTEREDTRRGFQGDVQYRNWDRLGDLEQLLIRGGRTWSPPGGGSKFTLGYAYVESGAYGPSSATVRENRLYQEALLPGRIGRRIYLTHRIRLEQRWVESQDFRTRLRYFIGVNYPLNQETLRAGANYLAFYNELFLNGERDIGGGRRVDLFDRNRLYAAIGRVVSSSMRVQLGYMHQQSPAAGKGQLQLNLLHSF